MPFADRRFMSGNCGAPCISVSAHRRGETALRNPCSGLLTPKSRCPYGHTRMATDPPRGDHGGRSTDSAEPDEDASRGLSVSAVTGAFALFGAAWFAAGSLFAGWVYGSVGVRPREVGLSSAALLTQASAGFIATIVLFFGIFFAVGFIGYLASSRQEKQRLRTVRGAMPYFAFFGLAMLGLFALSAKTARDSLAEGEKPGSVGPWSAEVAMVHPRSKDSPLPTCALYLGQADGTAVLVSVISGNGRTQRHAFRVPASSLTLDLRPDLDSCP